MDIKFVAVTYINGLPMYVARNYIDDVEAPRYSGSKSFIKTTFRTGGSAKETVEEVKTRIENLDLEVIEPEQPFILTALSGEILEGLDVNDIMMLVGQNYGTLVHMKEENVSYEVKEKPEQVYNLIKQL